MVAVAYIAVYLYWEGKGKEMIRALGVEGGYVGDDL